jgi:glycine hydroxymethyltransferase
VPFDPRKPFDPSGLRLGTGAITTRGLGTEQMPQIAEWIDRTATAANDGDETAIATIAAEVKELLSAYPMPGWV